MPSDARGCVDLDALRAVLDDDVAGIMLTNPNTLGLFEEDIVAIAAAVHERRRASSTTTAPTSTPSSAWCGPGDMGFDIVHLNLHKTFATPHGGGGPGAGPGGGVRAPGALPARAPRRCGCRRRRPTPASAGRPRSTPSAGCTPGTATPSCSPGPSPTSSCTAATGCASVAQLAVLNANWLRKRLSGTFDAPYDRPCMHECVLSAASLKRTTGVKALDVAKRLLEEGFHSPTVYFPLIVDEALMIEPTETESLQTLEALAAALERIAADAAEPGGADGPPRGAPRHPGAAGGRGPRRRATSCPPSTPAAEPLAAGSPRGRQTRSARPGLACLASRSAWWSEMACMMAPPTAPMNSGRFSAAQSRDASSEPSVPLEVGHDLAGEQLVGVQGGLPVGPFVGHEQEGAEAPGLLDQALDLGHGHLRRPHHGEPRLHEGVDQLVGVEGGRGERQGGHPLEVVHPLRQAEAHVRAGLLLGLGDVHRAHQPPLAAVHGGAELGGALLHHLPVRAEDVEPAGRGGPDRQQRQPEAAGGARTGGGDLRRHRHLEAGVGVGPQLQRGRRAG